MPAIPWTPHEPFTREIRTGFRFHWSAGFVLEYESWQLRAEDI
jgi:hypothetical protein